MSTRRCRIRQASDVEQEVVPQDLLNVRHEASPDGVEEIHRVVIGEEYAEFLEPFQPG